MQEGKILHIEDNAGLREGIADRLEVFTSHRVVAIAGDLVTALAQVDAIASGDLAVNVILLDGELEGDRAVNHPKAVVARAKERGITAAIVGLSGAGLEKRGLKVGEDIAVDLIKKEFAENPKILEQALDELPEPGIEV